MVPYSKPMAYLDPPLHEKGMMLNILDIFITFAHCYKPRLKVNGKEKNPLYFARNYSVSS